MNDEHDNEPIVIRSAPYCLPSDEHGYVYLVFGSLAAGAPRYEPDAAETARRQARQRWEQMTLALEAA